MHTFNPTILREYDVRGIVGKTLFEDDAYALGRTLGTLCVRDGGTFACVGYDGRYSSPQLKNALHQGLRECGLTVIDVGLVSTPMLYFATKMLEAPLGLMITGSHNPPQYNGFKIVYQQKPFFGDRVRALGPQAEKGDWVEGRFGGVLSMDIMEAYTQRTLQDFHHEDGFKVVWDTANGASGPSVERLIKELPGKHIILNGKVDGGFPNHHPDPTVEKNMDQLKKAVIDNNYDIGIGFDGDGDRIGIVDSQGRMIWGDQMLAILAQDVLPRHPGAPIIADVKSSQVFFDEIKRLGGVPIMSATGHSIIKSRMLKENAPLAGEMSAHIFFQDSFYGYDDALYVGVRFLNHMKNVKKSAHDLLSALPQSFSTPEIRIEVVEERKFILVEELKQALIQENIEFIDIDGVRITTPNGWWLLRASNTQNVVVVRAESMTPEGLDILKDEMRKRLVNVGVNTDAI